MSNLLVSAGRMLLQGNGQKRLDTDDGLLHVIPTETGWLTGTIEIPAVSRISNSISDPAVDLTTSYTLGSCNPDCTTVIGAIKFTLNNYNAGMAYDRWHTIFGGSVVWVYDGEPPLDTDRGRNLNVWQWVSYWFETSGGTVYMKRRLVLGKIAASVTILSHSITYKLKTARFT